MNLSLDIENVQTFSKIVKECRYEIISINHHFTISHKWVIIFCKSFKAFICLLLEFLIINHILKVFSWWFCESKSIFSKAFWSTIPSFSGFLWITTFTRILSTTIFPFWIVTSKIMINIINSFLNTFYSINSSFNNLINTISSFNTTNNCCNNISNWIFRSTTSSIYNTSCFKSFRNMINTFRNFWAWISNMYNIWT